MPNYYADAYDGKVLWLLAPSEEIESKFHFGKEPPPQQFEQDLETFKTSSYGKDRKWVNYKITMLLLIFSVGITITPNLGLQLAHAQQTHDITMSTDGKATGGNKTGTLTVTPEGHTVSIVANLTQQT